MKRYGNLWDQIISWDNLVLAARKAQRAKRDRPSVQTFNFNLERELLRLQDQLISGDYTPGAFCTHWIHYPKKRLISVAPYRDRVVHHALMNILEPLLDRRFHPHSYACRKDKGTHAAVDRLQKLMRKHKYALQCDIRRFFPAIDHQCMKQIFRKLIKDPKTLQLMDLIVDSSNEQDAPLLWFTGDALFTPGERRKGLPIGNLTSQWFANWYLNDMDHFLTSHCGLGAFVRYCDDFILLHDDRDRLRQALKQIEKYLSLIRLKLHKNKSFVKPVSAGLTFVGYRLWPQHRNLKKNNIRAFRRRLKWMQTAYAAGTLEWPDVKIRLDSWIAHAAHADTRHLIKQLSKDWKFTRAGVENDSCYSRRRLEQQCQQLSRCQPQQQHTVESQQQHRVSSSPALSRSYARNRTVHGPCECGDESPDAGPEPATFIKNVGRIIAPRPDGAGRIARTPLPAFLRRKACESDICGAEL